MNRFAFELNTTVVIKVSGETGTVFGRAEYLHHENSYYVEYKAADGTAKQEWWGESKLQAA